MQFGAVVTCEVKLFRNYFSLRRRPSQPSEIILPKTISKFLQTRIAVHEYFPTCSMSLQ